MTLLEKLPQFSLWHNPASACLHAVWCGRHAASLTRAHYCLIRWHVIATGSTKLLHDSQQDEGGWYDLVCWLSSSYFQMLAEEGVQAVAWVLPTHLAALCATVKVIARLEQPLVDAFNDAENAAQWLHRWPIVPPLLIIDGVPITTAGFLALSPLRQVALAEQWGHPLVTRWEAELYIKSYLLGDSVRVEVAYCVYPGHLYRVRSFTIPCW